MFYLAHVCVTGRIFFAFARCYVRLLLALGGIMNSRGIGRDLLNLPYRRRGCSFDLSTWARKYERHHGERRYLWYCDAAASSRQTPGQLYINK